MINSNSNLLNNNISSKLAHKSQSINEWERQQRIHDKAYKPGTSFTAFSKSEIEQSIGERFAKIVLAYPHQVAIKATNQLMTYAEVDRISGLISQSIIADYQTGQKPIVLLHEDQALMILSMLGGFKAGKICVPVDPAFHGKRAAYILRNSQPGLIITDRNCSTLANQLSHGQIPILDIETPTHTLRPLKPRPALGPETLAYLLYTSGTTGKPKPVIQNHKNFLHDMMGYTNSFHVCAEDRLTLFASCSGAQGLKTSFSALLNGATICLWNLQANGFTGLRNWLVSQDITMLMCSPTVFRNFVGALDDEERFCNIRLIKLGSEPVLESDVNLFKKHFPKHCVLVNWLSSTETGNFTRYFVDMETEVTDNIVPVGYPVADKQVLVLNESGHSVQAGQIGEIAVRSQFFPLGYWTEGTIYDGHFITESAEKTNGHEKTYRTGELGVIKPDGCLIHLGRKDSQVKILGRWIKLDDVELGLRENTEVREVAVIAQDTPSGDKSLVIFVVPKNPGRITAATVRQILNDLLPEHAIPIRIVLMDDLPLTANGKVDRQALSKIGILRSHLETPYTAPRTSLEKKLAVIWGEILSVKLVGIHDNFFDLGGHSLMLARLSRIVEARWGKVLPLNSIIRAPTIAQFASLLTSRWASKPLSSLVPLQPEGIKRPFFCIHEFFGDVLCYLNLARCLDSERPFYALQPPSLTGSEPPFTEIKAMATFYIEQIREIQAHGPYALGGFCSGGIVAFEMAQQLSSAGEKVDFLAFLNSSYSAGKKLVMHPRFMVNLFRDLPHWVNGAFQLKPSEWRQLVSLKFRMFRAFLARFYRSDEGGLNHTDFPPLISVMGDILHLSEKHLEIAHAQYHALRSYQPKPYPGRATLFRSLMQPLFSSHDPQKGWNEVITGGVEIKNIPGNQLSMLKDPYVKILAKELRFALDRADSAH